MSQEKKQIVISTSKKRKGIGNGKGKTEFYHTKQIVVHEKVGKRLTSQTKHILVRDK